MASDYRAAWTGVWPGAREVPIDSKPRRGTRQIRQLPHHRTVDPRATRDQPPAGSGLFATISIWPMALSGGFLAWRNLRLGRSDRRGAMRLALALFCVSLPADLLSMSHVPGPGETPRLVILFLMDLGLAAVAAVMYLALEPYVRRRSPRVLIGWTRLLQRGWRDPLVGSHVLAGMVLAMALTLVAALQSLVSMRRGAVTPIPPISLWEALLGAREFVGSILSSFNSGILAGLSCLFVFFLFRLVLRRDWLAGAALALLLSLGTLVSSRSVSTGLPIVLANMAFLIALTLVLVRLGLLALISMAVACRLLFLVPMTMDSSRWYFGYSFAVISAISVLQLVHFMSHSAVAPYYATTAWDEVCGHDEPPRSSQI